ncbi:unnamed protein product [Ranitomeya imitator]|uniref:Reverse transcriptase domain-containing protein n=1 Tax=Ranitomeya imitator TaxID=111125 RepID=A0ABN9KVZ1_9NEOB|nr:unnamed protein product [Ranitomeya imitator]
MLMATVSVIPKSKGDPEAMENFRPISLINVDIKIYSKILADRISLILPRLIPNDQMGFVKGRQPADATRRIIDIMSWARKNKLPLALLSLDAEKAFDRVDWDFLRESLAKFGFDESMISHIMALYSEPKASICCNCQISDPFCIKNAKFTLNALNLRVHSSFQPPHIYHPVETYIEFVRNDIKKVLESIERGNHHVRHNLTIEEKKALSTLKENKQIIIKPADKGGFYSGVGSRLLHATQLSDSDSYQPISNNPTFEVSKEIKDLVAHYTTIGTIDTKLGEFLVKQHPVTPVFYTIPKIHKHPLRPPGHPIVASTESLLSPLAITLDKILSPLVPKIKSYLKDTTDFLTSLQNIGRLPMNCLLVAMDVNSLYTSIRHPDGIESVISFLSRHTDFSSHQYKFCKDLLTLMFFIQKRGTAMGSNMAPPYANIFMDQYELSYIEGE